MRLIASDGWGNVMEAGTRQLVGQPDGRGAVEPLSFALTSGQQRLWWLQQYDQESAAYNVPFAIRFPEGADLVVVRAALTALVDRHEVLSVRYPAGGTGEPVQTVVPAFRIPLSIVDVPAGDDWLDPARVVANQPFELTQAPPVRAAALRCADGSVVLLLVAHHIAMDGVSVSIIVRDLATCYEAARSGRPADVPPPVVRFRDFVARQRSLSADEAASGQLDYWRAELAGFEPLDLPLDRPRPATPGHSGDTVYFELTAEKTAALQMLALRQRSAFPSAIATVFLSLLAQRSGQHDVTIGTVFAGRPERDFDEVVGFFVNTVVLRARISGTTTVRALLRDVHTKMMGAFKHQHVPFADIVAAVQPERDPDRNAVFDVLFAHQGELSDVAVNGTGVRQVRFPMTAAKFDLELQTEVVDGRLVGALTYRTDLFNRLTVDSLAAGFVQIVDQVLADPQVPVARLSSISDDERARVLADSRGPEPRPVRMTLSAAFARQALLTPGNTAVAGEGSALTYRELDARANHLARLLSNAGAGPDRVVALLMERSVDLVVAMLATIKAGSAYCPLGPGEPDERLRAVLAEARVSVLIADAAMGRRAASVAGDTPIVGVPASAAAAMAGMFDQARDPDELAYVLYTSGSTGVPKGVAVTHRDVLEFASDRRWDTGAHERVLLHTSHTFDVSQYEIWVPLLRGGQVVVAPPGALDIATLERAIRAGVTAVWLTAGLFRLIVDEAPGCFAGVRELWAGGDVVPPESVRRVLETCPDVTVVNGYGPTETTIFSASHTIRRPYDGSGPVPIGRPLDGTRCYVLGAELELLPAGVAGELYIAGSGLARGYLHRPDLSAERFVADPHGPPGSRMYRTGDLVRRRPDGALDFIGRADHQVKIRGFRVEIGDIETAIAAHPQVAQVAVLAREDVPGERRLVGYLVGAGKSTVDVSAINEYARARLPSYMLPSAIVVLDTLPLTPHGKVDRAALPAPGPVTRRTGRTARTPRERWLCDLVAELLGLEHVGPDDDFFALGGHSLLAMRLLSRIKATFGAEMPLRTVFDKPTVAGISAALDGTGTAFAGPSRRPRPDEIPLSYAQQRLWAIDQTYGPSPTYNIPMPLRISGELDLDALQDGLVDVMYRHEALRTVFPSTDGRPRQHIVEHVQRSAIWPAPTVTAIREDDLATVVTTEAHRCFDLTTELPVRARLFRLAPDEHVLVIVVHHIAIDGWSNGPFSRDLAAAYRARVCGRSPDWPDLPVQYADYTLWQLDLLGDDRDPASLVARQARFWRHALADLPVELDLPIDQPRPKDTSWRGGAVPFTLAAPVHARLLDLARSMRCSVFMCLQAALAAVLTRLGAGTDIPIGAPVAGRSDERLTDLVGFFVNTVVLRTDTAGDPGFRDLLSRVREADLAAFAHEDLPFERLIEMLNPSRSAARHPLFQVMLTVRQEADPVPALVGVDVERIRTAQPFAKFDLLFDCTARSTEAGEPSGMDGVIEYSADLFDRETVEDLATRLVQLIDAVLAEPDRPIGTLELMTDHERQRLAAGVDRTAHEVPDTTLPALFAAQVARTPDAPALVFDGVEVSYAELDARAGRLAQVLVARGAGPEKVVAVQVPRSIELMVALYAVHKAGAAYLPIDPELPPDRINGMLADAEPVAVLTPDAVGAMLSEPFARTAELPGPHPDNPAYVIFTSGSTGRPKGVSVSHRAVVNRLLWGQDTHRLGPDDRVLQKTPTSFDVSVWELFWPLLAGATLVVTDHNGHRDPQYLIRLIRQRQITTIHFVPSMLRAFLAEPAVASCTSLRRVLCSGEALPDDLRIRFFQALDAELHNLYGPTEAAVEVSHWRCRAEHRPGTVPIGRPVWNTGLYVLDTELRPLPPGVIGELYLAGVQLARGYHGRSDLTAERFVADPFGPPGTRMYRTGDLARRRRDGAVEYTGRVDHQVKIRGVRIELGEIEAAVRSHPAVAEAVVVARTAADGVADLVCYAVPSTAAGQPSLDPDAFAAAIRSALGERLPGYMVPSTIVHLSALPLNPSGKLDRGALPTPAPRRAATMAHPRTPQEEILRGVFADVLGVPAVGIHDDFFALGGHSLLGIRLISRVRSIFGAEVSIGNLFESPTPAGLAGQLGLVDERDPFEVLLPLRASGGPAALFFVHPAAGIGWVYSGLLSHVNGFRMYALQDVRLTNGGSAPLSVDEMAGHYVRLIRTVQPAGPYHLLGWSFGGLVAQAIATRLQAARERVDLLAMFDTYPLFHRPANGRRHDDPAALGALLESLGRPVSVGDGQEVADVLAELAGVLGGLDESRIMQVARLFEDNVQSGQQFVPDVFNGNLIHFAATADKGPGSPEAGDWLPYVNGRIERYSVSCRHGEMMRPRPLSVIGPALAAALPHLPAAGMLGHQEGR
jgi:nonribosomal peptide synthetase DhbF